MGRKRLGVAGVGQMGEAIIAGVLEAGWCAPQEVLASDVNPQRLEQVREKYQIKGVPTDALPGRCSILLIAVKPQDVLQVLEQWKGRLGPENLVISIAAGVGIGLLEGQLGDATRIVRVMPNNPCLIRRGCSALCAGRGASKGDVETAKGLFQALGSVVEVQEKWMDAVTALSGSGPAYVYLFMEALVEAGVRVGLPWNISRTLAMETMKGALGMLESTGEHPAVLRERVSSPGGTTLAGLSSLERGAFRWAVWQAVEAARDRSEQLGLVLQPQG